MDHARVLFELGRARYPGIQLPFGIFAASVERHASHLTQVDDERGAELYLACACAQGDREALRVLEDGPMHDAARAAASVCSSADQVEEVLQKMRELLVTGQGGRPGKMADYAGRASLKSWLCTVAVRMAISSRRSKGEQRNVELTSANDPRPSGTGPELAYLRRATKKATQEAVQTAVERLSAKQRLLLKLHLSDRVGIDGLAAMYRVGRSTAARWLADARASLLREAQRELRAVLRVTDSELASLAADVQSHIDVSLLGLLRTGP
jgi:RNA polymerase sigma-70 factor (ECF subfamily)